MATIRTLRIFVSSPGDVGQERLIATRTIERLQGEFTGYVTLEAILWEHEPLRASDHFQTQIIPPSETDIVICILWSRLGTRLPAQFKREDGSLYDSGTEWEFEDALRSFRERGAPDLMVYRKTAESHASMSNEDALLARLNQKKLLDVFIDRWFGNPKDSFRAAFHAFDSSDKFETLLETHLRKLIQEKLPARITDDGTDGTNNTRPILWHTGSPFRGLLAFDVEHAPVFFGRTRAIAGIREALLRQAESGTSFVLVFGMSGCGKSSLVRAGVLPTITQPGIIEGVRLWRWAIFRPSDSPAEMCFALARALLGPKGLPEMGDTGINDRELAALFAQAPERAASLITRSLERVAQQVAQSESLSTPPQARLALVVDQLEEIWTLPNVGPKERETFVMAVDALARSGTVWVIGTMRSDFYPRCAEIPALAALKEGAGQYDVLPSSFAEIGQMIRYPARAAGLRFEVLPTTGERLDDRIHEAAASDPEALPLLSFTLDQLFQNRADDGTLTFEAYERLGGLEGALSRRAEEVYSAQPEPVQATLPFLLRGLVALGNGIDQSLTARRVPVAQLAINGERKALLEAFVAARLIVTDRADDGQAVARVAHEALLRRWPRVQTWLADDRAYLQTRDRVAVAVQRWQEENRRPDFLLPEGKPLADAVTLLSRPDDLDKDTANFIERSRQTVRRRTWKRWLTVGVAVGVFVVSLGAFGLFSYGQWRKSERQERLALEAVGRLTYDVPKKLIDVPGSRPVLRGILTDNLTLLDRLDTVRAEADRRSNNIYMGDMWLMLGAPERAEGLYLKSLQLGETIARRAKTPTEKALAAWDVAVAHAKIADARTELVGPEAALPGYKTSLQMLQAIPETDLTDVNDRLRLLHDSAAGWEKLGDAHLTLGDATAALAAYDRDFALTERLVRERGATDRSARRDLALAHTKRGDALVALGQVDAARTAYRSGLGLVEALYHEQPEPAVRRTLVATLTRLGDLQVGTGDFAQAGKQYEMALVLAKIDGRDFTDVGGRRALSLCYSKIGMLLLAHDNLPAARKSLQAAFVITEEQASDKDNLVAQRDLKNLCETLRDVLARMGDKNGALALRERALLLDLQLQAIGQESREAKRQQAALWGDIGAVRLERNNLPGATEAYQNVLERCRALAENKHDGAAQRELASAYEKVAWVYLLAGKAQEAVALATEGTVSDGQNIRLQATLAHALLISGQWEQAKTLYVRYQSVRLEGRQNFADTILADLKELQARRLNPTEIQKARRLFGGT